MVAIGLDYGSDFQLFVPDARQHSITLKSTFWLTPKMPQAKIRIFITIIFGPVFTKIGLTMGLDDKM